MPCEARDEVSELRRLLHTMHWQHLTSPLLPLLLLDSAGEWWTEVFEGCIWHMIRDLTGGLPSDSPLVGDLMTRWSAIEGFGGESTRVCLEAARRMAEVYPESREVLPVLEQFAPP